MEKGIGHQLLRSIGGAVATALLIMSVLTTILVAKKMTEDASYVMVDSGKITVQEVESYFDKYIYTVQQLARDENVRQFINEATNRSHFTEAT